MSSTLAVPAPVRPPVDFATRPMLVFWETTRACQLACRHCRASATPQALPGELTEREGRQLIDQVAAFGRPHPILVLTGLGIAYCAPTFSNSSITRCRLAYPWHCLRR